MGQAERNRGSGIKTGNVGTTRRRGRDKKGARQTRAGRKQT